MEVLGADSNRGAPRRPACGRSAPRGLWRPRRSRRRPRSPARAPAPALPAGPPAPEAPTKPAPKRLRWSRPRQRRRRRPPKPPAPAPAPAAADAKKKKKRRRRAAGGRTPEAPTSPRRRGPRRRPPTPARSAKAEAPSSGNARGAVERRRRRSPLTDALHAAAGDAGPVPADPSLFTRLPDARRNDTECGTDIIPQSNVTLMPWQARRRPPTTRAGYDADGNRETVHRRQTAAGLYTAPTGRGARASRKAAKPRRKRRRPSPSHGAGVRRRRRGSGSGSSRPSRPRRRHNKRRPRRPRRPVSEKRRAGRPSPRLKIGRCSRQRGGYCGSHKDHEDGWTECVYERDGAVHHVPREGR